MCIVCMCVYISLPLEGELDLLVDCRTLGGKLVLQDGRNTGGTQKKQASRAGSRVYCLPLSPVGLSLVVSAPVLSLHGARRRCWVHWACCAQGHPYWPIAFLWHPSPVPTGYREQGRCLWSCVSNGAAVNSLGK